MTSTYFRPNWIGEVHHVGVALMAVLGMLLLVGVILTALWTGAAYRTWEPQTGSADDSAPSPKAAALRYMRGVAIALVGDSGLGRS